MSFRGHFCLPRIAAKVIVMPAADSGKKVDVIEFLWNIELKEIANNYVENLSGG